MPSVDCTRTITPEMRRELLAAWDAGKSVPENPKLWLASPDSTRVWFALTITAYGRALNGPLNVASGC